MNHITPDPGWDFLLTRDGRDLCNELTALHGSGHSIDELRKTLRQRGISQEHHPTLLSQVTLRSKAEPKFGVLARDLFFTQAGLEQASRHVVAQEHALRYTNAGLTSVADLGCGLGAESIAFLEQGLNVQAVEIDPLTARIAHHNLRQTAHIDRFEVMTAPAENITVTADAVFLDPARRTPGHHETKRLTDYDAYSPSLGFAFGLAQQLPTGIKLGPGFDRDLIPEGAEAQWVSVNGEVVEMGLWFGPLARPGVRRSALVIRSTAVTLERHELVGPGDAPDAAVGEVQEYWYEPDGAVIRARLLGLLAEDLNAHMLDEHIAYMTSDRFTPTPFAQGFRITQELSAKEKLLARELRALDIGTLEIKKRGFDVNPSELRKRLKLRGNGKATLILTRVNGHHRAFLAERVTKSTTTPVPR